MEENEIKKCVIKITAEDSKVVYSILSADLLGANGKPHVDDYISEDIGDEYVDLRPLFSFLPDGVMAASSQNALNADDEDIVLAFYGISGDYKNPLTISAPVLIFGVKETAADETTDHVYHEPLTLKQAVSIIDTFKGLKTSGFYRNGSRRAIPEIQL